MRNIFKFSHFIFVTLLSIGSLILAIFFENIQKLNYCHRQSECFFWGAFIFFFIFNCMFLIVLGYGFRIYFLQPQKRHPWLLVSILLIATPLYIFGIGKAFQTYAIATSSKIIISNQLKLTIRSSVSTGKFEIVSSNLKEILRHWHLNSRYPSSSCQSMSDLVLKDGTSLSIDDYGSLLSPSLESYIVNTFHIPVKNTTDGLIINCKSNY